MTYNLYNPVIVASQTQPAHAKPARAKPARAKPARAKPARAKPARAKPARAKPPPEPQYLSGIYALCEKYNIQYTYDNTAIGDATGIGDILFRILCIKYTLIPAVFTFNLSWFTTLYYSTDPITQLEFRLQLLRDLCKDNNIPSNCIKYVFSTIKKANAAFPYESIQNFSLNIDTPAIQCIDSEYIIFHTKCRHTAAEDYAILKGEIKQFCSTFKSNYTLIILGERTFPNTEETILLNITTVYTELLELNTYNRVLDLTVPDIYTHLDYSNYLKDVGLIKAASYNICFGIGGQLCTSLLFGKSVIYYCSVATVLNMQYLRNNNHFQYTTLNDFFSRIEQTNTRPSEPYSITATPIELTPHIRVGDLLIIKNIEQTYGLNIRQINISSKIIKTNRSKYTTKLNFLTQLITLLFPTTAIVVNKSTPDFNAFCEKYPVQSEYCVYNDLDTRVLTNRVPMYEDCLVFHTKAQHAFFMNIFNAKIVPELMALFSSFKTPRRIIIMGKRVTKRRSIYNELLLLRTHNTVIDLTNGELTESGNFKEFLNNINIINQCACNITFGNGDPFMMVSAFAKRKISLIPYVDECTLGPLCKALSNDICTSVDELEHRLAAFS